MSSICFLNTNAIVNATVGLTRRAFADPNVSSPTVLIDAMVGYDGLILNRSMFAVSFGMRDAVSYTHLTLPTILRV